MGNPLQSDGEVEIAPGGNPDIDPAKVLAFRFEPQSIRYTERDVSLYALGIGAATDPADAQDLPYVYEMSGAGHRVFPSFAVTFPFDTLKQVMAIPGLNFNPMMLLHGEQYIEVPKPLPEEATIATTAKIAHVYDKGKGALVIVASESTDEKGDVVARNESSLFIRGLGNFGGDRGPSSPGNEPPDRAPDAVVREKTNDNQALLYRLSGDRNPLHADPAMAAMGGFDKPILHGLCSFGFAVRAILKTFAGNDPARFKSVRVRFAKHVFPGETIVTEMWREGDRVVFRCKAAERDEVVISNAVLELQAPAAGAVATTTANQSPVQRVFDEIAARIAQRPELTEAVGAVFQFDVTGESGGVWTVDLKNGSGAVEQSLASSPDCAITIGDDDFVALMTGKLDGQQAFMQGKLKVSGNVMLATKLQLLR